MTPTATFAEGLSFLDTHENGDRIGVAISGGSDSTALLLLAVEWAKNAGKQVFAATVDHGLRPEAAGEALQVANLCARFSVPHETLVWADWDGAGNLQSEARQARYALLTAWAERRDINHVLLGHTMDDQAETVLMNLARGSGVDGLAAMSRRKNGLFARPLLHARRADLRDYLQGVGVPWIDDPSNDDLSYDRVRARQMMPYLQDLGLTAERLIATSHHMQRARTSLNQAASDFAQKHVRVAGADLVLAQGVFDLDHDDTTGRVFAAGLKWISGSNFRPRYKALRDAADAVTAGHTRTLHGVKLVPEDGGVRMMREASACSDVITSQGGEAHLIWDHRWSIFPTTGGVWPARLRVSVLGDNINEVKTWRNTGGERSSLMATPAVFDGATLLSAPAAGFFNGFSTQFVADFHRSLLTH
ncbi:tRNA(Ile)-lysidine synthase [Loktanella ponticola]|uniref:tRNA(Ile)-lysidine synthase n=1 Tax=Yoonia ponticola TaxID=1524255 RepID=A0A7W9BL42_9RHOB|nr:tRNA lysidine(34) synthetase TilS [Yoonia ponticola]MBB5722460.1 tRNA(Ile)-lysidine synthase [Yoonia ponticola]